MTVHTSAALSMCVGLLLGVSAQQPTYRITHSYTLGGDGFWDYIVPDPPRHRLFVARQTRVMVVDEDTGKLVGEVARINGAHGTAIAAATGHGFATSGTDQAVVMFDLTTLMPLKTIPAAEDADENVEREPMEPLTQLIEGPIDPNDDTLFVRLPWEERKGKLGPAVPNYGADILPHLGLNDPRTLGLTPLLGFTRYTYGFLDRPYSSMLDVNAEYATQFKGARVSAWAHAARGAARGST